MGRKKKEEGEKVRGMEKGNSGANCDMLSICEKVERFWFFGEIAVCVFLIFHCPVPCSAELCIVQE